MATLILAISLGRIPELELLGSYTWISESQKVQWLWMRKYVLYSFTSSLSWWSIFCIFSWSYNIYVTESTALNAERKVEWLFHDECLSPSVLWLCLVHGSGCKYFNHEKHQTTATLSAMNSICSDFFSSCKCYFYLKKKISQFQRDKTYQFPGCSLCSWGKKSVCLRFSDLPHVISTPSITGTLPSS